MRVVRKLNILEVLAKANVMRLDAVLVNEDIEQSAYLIAPEPPELPDEIVSDLLLQLSPGNERVCAVLKTDGLSYKAISSITGLSLVQINTTMDSVRVKLKNYLTKKGYNKSI